MTCNKARHLNLKFLDLGWANTIIPDMATPVSKPSSHRPPAKAPLSNAKLLKLAKKRKPPQAWYDEGINPFQPKR